MIESISIVGTGNVAFHLARVFLASGLKIVQVVARDAVSARRFSSVLPVTVVTPDSLLKDPADLIILAVSDDGIQEAARSLHTGNALVVHTSGSVPMEMLQSASENIGVFYPLQTLTFGKEIDFWQIPVLIESNSEKNTALLKGLAEKITSRVYQADSWKRSVIHLAAVFASNFSYHMYTVASRLLEMRDIPPEILHPLILETARKAVSEPPGSAQTGPACRNDLEVLARHRGMLSDEALYGRIYELMSDSIIFHSNKEHNEL